jgi:hypothetical protein
MEVARKKQLDSISVPSKGRRSILKLSVAVIAAPTIWIPKASAVTQLFVRAPGGL